jgi:ribonuclease HI
MSDEAIITIHADGGCRGNPGPGGWGVVLQAGAHEKELWGGEADTTNNRMELTAAIRALEALKKPATFICTPIRSTCKKASASGFTTGNAMAGAPRTSDP